MHSAFSVVVSVAFSLVILEPFASFAGHLVGNGGFSIQCKPLSTNESSLMALDVYDAKPHVEPFVISSESSTTANVERLLGEIKLADDILYRQIVYYWNSFDQEVAFVDNHQIPSIEDFGRIERYPPHCIILLTIFQRSIPDEFGKRYLISQTLWDSLDSVSRAALIVHELIYRELIRRGQRDSVSTRRFVGYLLQGTLSRLSKGDYEVLRRQTYLDEFQLVIRELGRTIKIRYFDRIQGDFNQSLKTCHGAGYSSGLADSSVFKSIFDNEESPLARELRHLHQQGIDLFWTKFGYLYSLRSSELIPQNDRSIFGRILCIESID